MPDSPASLSRTARRRLWLAGSVALLGIALSMAAGLWISDQAQQRLETEFEQLSERLASQLQLRLAQPSDAMGGVRGTLAVNGDLTRLDLRAYVEARELSQAFPGVRGIGIVKRVLRDDIEAFVQAERADGAADFKLSSLSKTAQRDLYVITQVEPAADNSAVRGLDAGSDPARRWAFERAVTSGLPTMSAPLRLLQDQAQKPAVLIALPAYRPGTQPETPQQRIDALWGFFYAPVVLDELLYDFSAQLGDAVALQLEDLQAGSAQQGLLYRSPEVLGAGRTRRVIEFEQYGRPLRMSLQAGAAFEARFAQWPAGVVAGAGALLSYLAAAFLFQATRARELAEQHARSLTADLERMALVAQRTHNAVAICDAQRHIVWINEGFMRLTGFAADEAQGRRPGELLAFELGDAKVNEQLLAALDAGEAFHGELANRRRDGAAFWAAIEAQPLRDGEGGISGFLLILSDISERKQAELALQDQRQRLANVVEGTGLGTWEWHLPSGEVLINEIWATMLGASLQAWGLPDGRVGLEHFNALLHPDDVPKVFQAIERHLRGEADYEVEMRLRHADGHFVWVLARGKLLTRASDGSPERMFGTHLDISERKATEQALARERQTLEQVITASNLGTWEWHVPSGRIQRNAQWARMIGYTLEELGERAVDVDLETLSHPDDRAAVHLAIERHFSGEAPFLEMERRLRHKDGHWVWLLSRGRLLTRLPDGQPERVFGTITDISSQKAAEAQLATSRDLLDRTGRIAGIGGWVYELRAETVHWTEQTAVIHDLPPGHQPAVEEAIGYFAPDAQLALVGAIAELREHGGQFDLELPMVTAKDRRIWVRLVAEAETEGGQPTRLVGAIQDISARREAQQMIRRSAELLRGAVDALEMPFALFDPQDLLVYCNEPFRTAFEGLEDLIRPGISYATMLREVLDHGSLLPEGADAEAWVQETVARRRRGPVTELAQYADGRVMRLIDRVMPDGHVVSFRIDLTEMVRAKQVAEEAALAKGQFLANMSHEIRTPLNAVLGMMALLGRTRLDTRQADYLGKAEGAARALLGILNDTLDFSKIEAGKMEIDPQPFQLDGLLRDLGVILAPAVKDKPVELLFDVAADVPRHLLGDAMRLQQVLVNLGGNALKFTASGEVVVRISRIAEEGDKVRLQFEVQDTGIGISPEQQSRLFTGFAQAEAGITRRFGGTGLGLVISQRLVALMGGQLQLESELGSGSCFRFSLWLPRAAKPAHTPQSSLRSLHLLVVDDHEATREVLGRQAQELGWQVSLAASGEQALQQLVEAEQRGEPVEAVLLDYRMPGLDGFETARRIRQTGSGQRSPLVVMITAHGRELLAEHEEQTALLDGFLVKPITASMMLDALATAHSSGSHAVAALPAPGTQRLLGLRLLLVEDNAINQQVATELLGAEGASIQLAGNGVEAISLLRQQPADFDIVLMDLQMPEMDGLTATRLLRGELGLRQLPVVAMTANASAADRQACLDAGMNDHVGKPFDLDQLVAVLQAQAAPALREGRALPAPTQHAAPPGEPAEVQHAAQAAGVQLATALARMGGLRDVYARMLEAFVAELPQHLAQLPVDDSETRARRLHTLKGVTATLGMDALAKQLADAEPQAADAAHPKLRTLAAALQEAQPGLRRLLVAMRPAAPAAAQPKTGVSPQAVAAELQRALQALQRCLLAHDAAALDLLPGLRPLLEPERYEPLAAAVESFAFAKAQQLVASWSAAP